MTFYERLESLTKQNNISFNKLGEIIEVSGASINGWKNGSVPRADISVRIAKYFNVSVEWLVTGQEKTYSPETLKLAEQIFSLPKKYQDIIKLNVDAFSNLVSSEQ